MAYKRSPFTHPTAPSTTGQKVNNLPWSQNPRRGLGFQTVSAPGGVRHVYPRGHSVFVANRPQAPSKGISGPQKGQPWSSTPQTPGGTLPLPVDPRYDQDIASLGRNRDTSLGSLGAQRTQGLLDYGYNEANDTLTFDPQNPYSQAALLKQSYDRSRKGAGTSMAARGQLYSGAYQNAQDDLYSKQGQSENALMKALQGFLTKNTAAQGQAKTDYEEGAGSASLDRLDRLPQNPLYEPGASLPPTGPSLPSTTARRGVRSLADLRRRAKAPRKGI